VGKIGDFRLKPSRKRYEIGPWLLWDVNRKSLAADRSVWVSTTLKGGKRGLGIFKADLLNNTRTVWPRTIKFGRITCGEWRISMVSYAPTAGGRGPSATQLLGFPSIYAYVVWRRTTKLNTVTHIGGLFLSGQPRPPPHKGVGAAALTSSGGSFLFMRTLFVAQLPNLTW